MNSVYAMPCSWKVMLLIGYVWVLFIQACHIHDSHDVTKLSFYKQVHVHQA